jgi:hypothetical protein
VKKRDSGFSTSLPCFMAGIYSNSAYYGPRKCRLVSNWPYGRR